MVNTLSIYIVSAGKVSDNSPYTQGFYKKKAITIKNYYREVLKLLQCRWQITAVSLANDTCEVWQRH